MFSSSTSVLSRSSSGNEETGKSSMTSFGSSAKGIVPISTPVNKKRPDAHPYAASSGLKLFIQGPYDCVLAVKRDLQDHLKFLLQVQRYAEAWKLIDQHPEIVDVADGRKDHSSAPSSPASTTHGQNDNGLMNFFADEHASSLAALHSAVEEEKLRIGELWLQRLVGAGEWAEAGRVAGQVLGARGNRWEHWVLIFAQAGRFDEITPCIPPISRNELIATTVNVPSLAYEVVLGHYIGANSQHLKELLELWDPNLGLYDTRTISAAVETRLESEDLQEGTQDWTILLESLAKLNLAEGRAREALKCYIRVQNADAAMRVVREEKERLADVIKVEDIPGLLTLRINEEQTRAAPLNQLDELSREAIQLLVKEAYRGTLVPGTVIRELERRDRPSKPFIFVYLRALWHGTEVKGDHTAQQRRKGMFDLQKAQRHTLVEDHANLAVELFAEYDRDLLMTFLRASEVYSYEKAAAICEQRDLIPELVYLLAKTGQTKRALFLISDLGDVSQAIAFVRENPDLWDDLLEYNINKPAFFQSLLSEVSTIVDPVQLVRRIPNGLEIDGLKEGVANIIRESDIQYSISEGVAKALKSEVSSSMDMLRAAREKGLKFEITYECQADADLTVVGSPTQVDGGNFKHADISTITDEFEHEEELQSGHCVGCWEVFHEDDKFTHYFFPYCYFSKHSETLMFTTGQDMLVGFACGHIFHLSCLMKANHHTFDNGTVSRLQNQLGYGGSNDDSEYSGRTERWKVAHAHIIRGVATGGCPHCHHAV